MDSVISSSSALAGSPERARTLSTTSARSVRMNWMPEMFTATFTGVLPSRCHPRASRHASSSTHSPMGTMRPLSSAMGMKRAGEIWPALRTVPAQERLGRDHAARGQLDDRLVGERQLTALEGAAEAVLQLEVVQHVDCCSTRPRRSGTRSGRSSSTGTWRCRPS